TDVVLGFDSLAEYDSPRNPYFGGVIGRVANRIAGARYELDGRTHALSANEGRHQLHGGPRGFDRVVWDAFPDVARASVLFRRVSSDGEGGHPGRLAVDARYTLEPGRSLTLELEAATDAPTPVDLTQHSYFNLAGGGTILEHELELRASRRVVVDREKIPTGELAVLAGELDSRRPRALGGPADGHDLCFALDGERARVPAL